MKIAIIGAGASGLMCAGLLAEKGCEVHLFDGNQKSGKKLYITGKGRCNFTNVCSNQDFLENVVRGEKFLYSCLNEFSTYDTYSFFEERGLKCKIERGNRAFPESDKSSDIIKILNKHCEKCFFHFNEKVVAISKKDKFIVISENCKYEFEKVVVATGGKSYTGTGSLGDGFKFAKILGHRIIEIKPALVPIELSDAFIKTIQGLSLKNVTLKAIVDGKSCSRFGEMLFTDKGISGPIALTMSSFINRGKEVKLSLDLKPALSKEQIEKRILQDFDQNKNKNFSSLLKDYLPNSLINAFLDKCSLSGLTKINNIKQAEREKIIESFKNFELNFVRLYPIECAIITSGGVNLTEVNPKTMESKLIKDLFFVGEVLDIDALTGGFNLQIAFSTAYACAKNIGG